MFDSIIEGKKCCSVQFTRVLHVPMPHHNLLSVLFLTKQREFKVHIDGDHMHFIQDGTKYFVAFINDNNSAFLDGSTQTIHALHRVPAIDQAASNNQSVLKILTPLHHWLNKDSQAYSASDSLSIS